jgi:formylglycine-generating enzyme required for sulfatase activity
MCRPVRFGWVVMMDVIMMKNRSSQMELPYAYWLGQYPVSQAQYAQFVAAGGYGQAAYWSEAAERGYWRDGRFKGRFDSDWRTGPYPFGHPYNLPNHPVVGISWYEAIAFCRWLTERWQAEGWLPKEWQVQLPSEPEWEKGAKGGWSFRLNQWCGRWLS